MKRYIISIIMTFVAFSSYATFMYPVVTYTTDGAIAHLDAEDYNPITVYGDPYSWNIVLSSSVYYAVSGHIELEQVEYSDYLIINEVDASGNVISVLGSYSGVTTDVLLFTTSNTGRIRIDMYCFYGATCETSGFNLTIRPVDESSHERMIITNRLGVGTSTPQSTLHVRGASTFTSTNGGYMTADANFSTYNLSTNRGGFMFNKPIYNTGLYGASSNNNLTLYTGSSPRMTILNSNGNVGIGIETPQYKLDVAGKIHAEEIHVDLDNGADFVFGDNYNLTTLQEVQRYIKEHKHLPGISSAEDMQNNGVTINKLLIQLLQKIEELTLYQIQLEENIKELQTIIESHEK